ncbi:glycosyltransferase [Prosthecobacter sp.]|uniref:glycosyltransferase n=1 Tax=Prosthecobacter sp. TaxID=1965333 RepID=UPI00378444DC
MSTPRVTWIMPVLNGMPFLPAALESLRQQTFQDQQVYVWDNGSTDGTLEVLREWIPARIPGKVFVGQPLSLGMSLKRLLEEAPSSLVARMDADDICLPHRLATQVAHLDKHPGLTVIGSERISIDLQDREIPRRSAFPPDYFDILHATLRAPRVLHPSVLMRRDQVLEIGGYQDLSTPDSPYWCEDYDLWLRILSKHKVEALPEPLIRYRYNPDSLTETEMRLNRSANAKRRAWLINCKAFAGIHSSSVAGRLWDRRLFLSMPVILGIARHFQSRDGLKVSERLKMPSFVRIAQSYLRREDLISRIWLRGLSKKFTATNNE